jgi:hypothetical protein
MAGTSEMERPEIPDGTATMWLGGDAFTYSILLCPDHLESEQSRVTEEYDSSMGDPLRSTWKQWFVSTPLYIWFENRYVS